MMKKETAYDYECGRTALEILQAKAQLVVMHQDVTDDRCIRLGRKLMIKVIQYDDPATGIRAEALADTIDMIDNVRNNYQRVPAVVTDIYNGLCTMFDDCLRRDALATYYATGGYADIDWEEAVKDVH